MTSPNDDQKEYTELYHSFTEAYINVHSLTRDFYPQAKKFVEHTEPELVLLVEKLSNDRSSASGPFAYQKLVQYVNHFDDFTISANKLFGDLRIALHNSDSFMNRLLEHKMNADDPQKNSTPQSYKVLIPQLTELIANLNRIPERAAHLETKMNQLENDWKKTKENIQ